MLMPFKQEYLEKVYNWYSSEKYPIFFRHFESYLSIEEFSVIFSTITSKCFLLNDHGHVFGFIMAKAFGKPKLCEISVMLEEEYQGRGLGKSATVQVLNYLFLECSFNRSIAITAEEDDMTQDILEKGGFSKEASYKSSCFYNGNFHDEYRYAISRGKFLELYGGDYG